MVNLTADSDNLLKTAPAQYLAGVNFTALGMDDAESLTLLWKQHEAQQGIRQQVQRPDRAGDHGHGYHENDRLAKSQPETLRSH